MTVVAKSDLFDYLADVSWPVGVGIALVIAVAVIIAGRRVDD